MYSHYQIKDLGSLKYFLGIEVAQSKEGIVVSQRKYALGILEETCMTNCSPIDSPMDPNQKLMADQGETYSDSKDIKDWLESSFISQLQDLTSLS